MGGFFSKIFPSKNTRTLRRMQKNLRRINALEERFRAYSDAELGAQTDIFRQKLAVGESLEALLPEAFAAVREAGLRTLQQRHYDVQLIGGMVLHEGCISEMRTGEGKTLVATLPAYLNALSGRGVHIITVNDYLAKRDGEWMRPLYQLLGLTVGFVVSDQSREEKVAAYQADITYGTNNEFGFDYLRDNMVFTPEDQVQKPLHYAIVDEVDSILIDEARTPLVISGADEDSADLYIAVDQLITGLKRHIPDQTHTLAIDRPYLTEEEIEAQNHYVLDEKNRTIEFTEKGHALIEERLRGAGFLSEQDSLYASANLSLLQHVQAALKAHVLFRKDVDYLVRDGTVMIIDEHTGRVLSGRRWSEGIHQAIEAKEKVAVQNETHTLASITFQNYFRLYEKLAGMTGTADTEAFEFKQIYGLDVVIVPTNCPMIREDCNDLVYMTRAEKFDAIIADIQDAVATGRPVLVGTVSVQSSELLSRALRQADIQHEVLNAKQHQREAGIITQAGKAGMVTIATNMAGRGTDIVLGGNWEAVLPKDASPEQRKRARADWQEHHDQVVAAGGLHVIGTERHESRRIDNQLRGRSGRQGDPGSSRFYLSMEDDLMRIFASDQMRAFMQRLGMPEGEAVEHRMVTNSIERAQRKVEGRNFDIRKNLLEYDDVANSQRQVIYKQRKNLMTAGDISETLAEMRTATIEDLINGYIPPESIYESWDIPGLDQALKDELDFRESVVDWLEADDNLQEEAIRARIVQVLEEAYREKEAVIGAREMRLLEKHIMLMMLDQLWKEHLATMDYLRQGIGLRAYAQKQPKQEYKREAFKLFENLLYDIRRQTVGSLCRIQTRAGADAEEGAFERSAEKQRTMLKTSQLSGAGAESAFGALPAPESAPEPAPAPAQAPFMREGPKVGRNHPCPCGSGKKYKHCHGR